MIKGHFWVTVSILYMYWFVPRPKDSGRHGKTYHDSDVTLATSTLHTLKYAFTIEWDSRMTS